MLKDKYNFIKVTAMLMLLPSVIYAGDAWLGDCDFLCMSGLLAIPGLIMLFIIWVFVAAFNKNNSANSFFTFSAILLFSIILLSIIRESISSYIEHENYTPKHHFMEGYKYGKYEANETIVAKSKYPIIDLYLNEYTYTSYRRNLSFLQKNGIFNCDDGEHIIDLNRNDITMAYCQSGGSYLKLYSKDKKIQIYDINSSKLLGRYNQKVPTNVSLTKDYILNEGQSAYRTKSSWFNDDYRKLYVDHLNQTDKDISSERKVVVYINKSTHEIIPYYNGVSYQSTKIDAVPLLAQYDNEKDIIYVVYEGASDINVFVNKFSKTYADVENIVKQSIDYTYSPWWHQEDEPNHLDSEMSKRIYTFFDNKHTDVTYSVHRDGNNTFLVTVNIEHEPYKSIIFKVNPSPKSTIESVIYKDRVYGKNIIDALIMELKSSNNELAIIRILTKLEIAIIHIISDNDYNHNIDNEENIIIRDKISKIMRERFYNELKKDEKLYNKVDKVKKVQNFLLINSQKFSTDCGHFTYSINKCTEITLGKAIWYFEHDVLLKKPINQKYVNIINEIDKSGIKVDKYNHLRVMEKYLEIKSSSI